MEACGFTVPYRMSVPVVSRCEVVIGRERMVEMSEQC